MEMAVDLFLCPECKQLLVESGDVFVCLGCNHTYRTIDGILNLLPRELARPTQEDIYAWEDRNSGRTEHQPSWLALLSKEAEIRQFRQNVQKHFSMGKILEIGGGLCWCSMIIKQMFPGSCVIATDVSLAAMTKAREVASLTGTLANRYIACDIQKLPFPDECFDICFGSEVIHHLVDPVTSLAEIRRVLKSGGRYIGMGEGCATKPMQWIVQHLGLDRSNEAIKYKMLEKLYTIGQWTHFFKEVPFSSVEFSICKNPSYQYQTRFRLVYYLLLSCLPDFVIKNALGASIIICAEK